MSFLDKIKQKAEELDLETKAKELADAAAKAAQQAKEKAGEIAHEQRDKVEEVLDKAGHAIDEKTEGKYHDKVVKAKDSVVKGVDKLAEQRVVAPDEDAVDEPGPYFDPDAGVAPGTGARAAEPGTSPMSSTAATASADEAVMDVDAAAGDEVVPEGDGPIAGPAQDGSAGPGDTRA